MNKKEHPASKLHPKLPIQAAASSRTVRPSKTAHAPSRQAKKPAAPRRPIRALLMGLAASALVSCVAFGLVAFMPASPVDQRPLVLAALFTATPTSTATPTETPTATASPTASPTPTITLTPTETPIPTETPVPSPTSTSTPLPTPDSRDRQFVVPILMYHYLSIPPADADVYRKDLSVSPEAFREQLGWLKENGYETISLYDLIYALNIGWPPLPDKPIILTFDDGYVDNYENAFPALKEMGYTATFFILTDVTDRNQPGYMSWDMLREMSAAGMSIEVHGREHIEMNGRDRDWLLYHLLGPAQTIEANLGYVPRFLAYPAGKYDALTIETAREVGYWGALTTMNGILHTKDNPMELKRLRIRGDWNLNTFVTVVTTR